MKSLRYNPEDRVDKIIKKLHEPDWSTVTITTPLAAHNIEDLRDEEIPEEVIEEANKLAEQIESERYVACYSEAYEDVLRDIAIGWQIEGVIHNGPATIVLWKDHTKTMAICDPVDEYNMSAGIAICMAKKAFGNETFRQILEAWDPAVEE